MVNSAASIPATSLEDLVIALGLLWAFIVALLIVRAVGKRMRRRWPVLARIAAAMLPLPCQHVDRYGARLTYRERRELNGLQVMHWVCDGCGHAWPIVDRSDADHQRITAKKPAHEAMRARIITPAPTPADLLRADFLARRNQR